MGLLTKGGARFASLALGLSFGLSALSFSAPQMLKKLCGLRVPFRQM